jgi:hypothetical protein
MTEETKHHRPTDEQAGHAEEACVVQSSQEKLGDSVPPSISLERQGNEQALQHSETANTNKKQNRKTESLDLDQSKAEGRAPSGPSDEVQAATETSSIDAPETPEGKPKVDSSVAILEAKQRIIHERQIGRHRPLGRLRHTEIRLEERSQTLQILSAPKPKERGTDLLMYQIDRALNMGGSGNIFTQRIRRDNFALYASLDSNDPIDSILNRHIVMLSHAAMECQHQFVYASNPQKFDVYARHTEKMTQVLIELIEARERRRRPKQVVVGNVKIEAGGQAIVGTVEAPEQRARSDDDASDDSTEPSGDKRQP